MKKYSVNIDGRRLTNWTEEALIAEFGAAAVSPVLESAKMDLLRGKRDAKLASCDWTQAADSPLSDADKALWATYRQELRDLPDNTATADAVIWPFAPF